MVSIADAIRQRGRRDWRDGQVGDTQRASSHQLLLLCIWANGKYGGAANPVAEDVGAAKTDAPGGDEKIPHVEDERELKRIGEKSCFLETTYIWTALGYRRLQKLASVPLGADFV
ncbi:hypothetical protein L2E82_45963 [Cichorium intybus]|uniref:Uncharacterized protein n=1 Tax=Cichorium intybus TaxID=13427 RepID=A0ACB8ZTJ0_CICIN|nr:hypothetical protein L2E82_45963 [Cichorium intybus]